MKAIRACVQLVLVAAIACAAAAAPSRPSDSRRYVGVHLVAAGPASLARAGAVLVDELMGRLGQSDIDSIIVSDDCSLLADTGLRLPELGEPEGWADKEPALREITKALGLTDLVIVRVTAKDGAKKGLAAKGLWLAANGGWDVIAASVPGEASDEAAKQAGGEIAGRLLNSPLPSAPPQVTAPPIKESTPPAKESAPKVAPPPASTAVAPKEEHPVPAAEAAAKPAPAVTTTPGTPATTAPSGTPAPLPETQPAAAPAAEKPSAAAEPAALPPSYDAAIRALGEESYGQAMEFANKALAEGAPRGRVCLLRAMIFAAKRDTAAEMRELEAAIDADAQLIAPRLKLAELYNQRGLWQKAVEIYKAAIAQDKTASGAYIGLSRLYETNRQPKSAQEILEQGAQAAPDDPVLLLEMGDLYVRRGLTSQAEGAYTNAARAANGKSRTDALQRLGDVYANSQRYREAFICYAELARSHDAGASVMAEKRYRQVMNVVDKAVAKALDDSFEMLDRYTRGAGVTRVEAYDVVADAARQLKDAGAFCADALPPPNAKAEHGQRGLYYSVAQEAIIAAQTYLDTSDKDALQAAQDRLSDARQEQAHLAKLGGG